MDAVKGYNEYGRRVGAENRGIQVAVAAVPSRAARGRGSLARALMVLFKARIVFLLLFAAVGGAFLGAGSWPGACCGKQPLRRAQPGASAQSSV